MKFEKTEVWGFDHAVRGMRNPLESWDRSDSMYCTDTDCENCKFRDIQCGKYSDSIILGDNDLALMQRLSIAGSEHRKFMRQIFVSVDITAPLYWWKEFDTYKIGTVANSTSTMHKLASTPITTGCFEMDDFVNVDVNGVPVNFSWNIFIGNLESLRQKYNETKDKRYWKELIRLLPESWLQTRTITMNYENILNMYQQRKNHKLSEWSVSFVEWVEKLPYANELFNIA